MQQIMIASPMPGRPEAVAAGRAGIVIGGPAEAPAKCRGLFEGFGGAFKADADPAAAAAIKIANNFVLGCAIEAMGEGFSLVQVRRRSAGVPLPSGNVWRDRLVGAVAHGDGGCDWAVMARARASPRRASGLA